MAWTNLRTVRGAPRGFGRTLLTAMVFAILAVTLPWFQPIHAVDSSENGPSAGIFGPNVRVDDKGALFAVAFRKAAYVDENGTIYVVWNDGRNSPGAKDQIDVYFAKSLDGGQTYTPNVPVAFTDNLTGGDPDMQVAEDGTIFVVFWESECSGDTGNIFFSRSTDGGASFSPPVVIDGHAWNGTNAAAGGPSLARDGDILYVVWDQAPEDTWGRGIFLARSVDRGDSWDVPRRIDDAGANNVSFPEIDVDAAGAVYVTWVNDSAWTVNLQRSDDYGLTFGPSVRINAQGWLSNVPAPVVATDAGEVYVVWENVESPARFAGNSFLSKSTDGGQTFSPMVKVDDLPLNSTWTGAVSADVDGWGNVYVVWTDDRADSWGRWDVYMARSVDGGGSFEPDARVNDTPLDDGIWQTLAAVATNSTGFLVVSWTDGRRDPILGDIYAAVPNYIPDFSIDTAGLSWSPPSPIEGAPVTLNATVHNVGTKSAPTTVRFSEGVPPSPQIGADRATGAIPPGGTALVSVTWTAGPPGTYEVCAFADPDNVTAEFSEENNLACTNLTVAAPSLEPPSRLTTGWDGSPDVVLDWTPSPSASVDHYLVFYADSPRGFADLSPGSAHASVPAPSTTWTDADVASTVRERYYLVRAANANESDVSVTTNTAGVFVGPLNAGTNVISRPLEYFPWVDYAGGELNNMSEYRTAFGADAISYMDFAGRWQSVPGAGNPDTILEVGKAYLVDSSAPGLFVFTGLPGAMLLYDEYAYAGFDPAADALSLDAAVSSDNVTLTFTQPTGMTAGVDYYEVYYAPSRTGFFDGSAQPLPGSPFTATLGATMTVLHQDAVTSPNGEVYYIVVPFSSGQRGSSSYSIGVWTRTFQGHETMGLPLRPLEPHSVDWYCDAIPNALGVLFLRDGVWTGHFREMPNGVYDAPVEQGVGYQVAVSPNPGRHSFVGS